MKEEWRAVPGYEGLYEVSNMGRVRSLDRIVRASGVSKRRAFGRVLRPYVNKLKYQFVALSKEGKSKSLLVHRIVASVFIPNPNGYNIINHKDENPSNNCVDNLEWCTQMYNVHYGTGMERGNAKYDHGRIAIDKLDLEGNYICTYPSATDAALDVGVTKQSILSCVKGRGSNGRRVTKSAGYKWRYHLV